MTCDIYNFIYQLVMQTVNVTNDKNVTETLAPSFIFGIVFQY